MVSLEAGEYERVVLQRCGQFRGCLGLDGRVDGFVEGVVCFLDKRSDGGVSQHIRRETTFGENFAHGAVKHLMVKLHMPDTPGRESKQVRLIQRPDSTVEKAVMVCFCLLLFQGAIFFFVRNRLRRFLGRIITPYSKKEPADCLTPVIGILYLLMKYCGSISKYCNMTRSSSRCSAGE